MVNGRRFRRDRLPRIDQQGAPLRQLPDTCVVRLQILPADFHYAAICKILASGFQIDDAECLGRISVMKRVHADAS
jgi:hypothetical protein